ncbi:MAG: hypothetical protein FJW63_07915 [Actinobacteria bacterium]|nr:hypothetical protein [Actinomycetota bacterium]
MKPLIIAVALILVSVSRWAQDEILIDNSNDVMLQQQQPPSSPEYICPIHGDIGGNTISFNINGKELPKKFCVRCWYDHFCIYLPKLIEKSQ